MKWWGNTYKGYKLHGAIGAENYLVRQAMQCDRLHERIKLFIVMSQCLLYWHFDCSRGRRHFEYSWNRRKLFLVSSVGYSVASRSCRLPRSRQSVGEHPFKYRDSNLPEQAQPASAHLIRYHQGKQSLLPGFGPSADDSAGVCGAGTCPSQL